MDIKLKWPFCRILAIAKYNFSPTESNQLPLKEGCTLKILSKEGDQKGWWKGQIGDKVIDLFINITKIYISILIFRLVFFQKFMYKNTRSTLWKCQIKIEFNSDVINALIRLQPEVENNLWGSGPNEIICNSSLKKKLIYSLYFINC